MHATQLPKPFHRDGWVYEEKYDGWRVVAYKDHDVIRLVSRPGRDHTARFPGLVAALRGLRPATLILDGEVAIFDDRLVSRFEWLRHGKSPDVATPPLYMAFDCVFKRGKDLRERPLGERRQILEDLIDGQRLILPARRLAEDGLAAWAEVVERGYEGLVAKDPTAPYVGGRTLKWLKVKQPHYREGERGWEAKDKA